MHMADNDVIQHFSTGSTPLSDQSSVPSYKGLRPASSLASRVKQHNRGHDTAHEILLRRELWRMGLRYRKNVESMLGKPDLVFPGARVVVFCDGDFWHGRDWNVRREKLSKGTNARYWVAKINSNIERDIRTTQVLEAAGWQVIRIWEGDIKRDTRAAASLISEAVHAQKSRQ